MGENYSSTFSTQTRGNVSTSCDRPTTKTIWIYYIHNRELFECELLVCGVNDINMFCVLAFARRSVTKTGHFNDEHNWQSFRESSCEGEVRYHL